jgi:hypothetical protein
MDAVLKSPGALLEPNSGKVRKLQEAAKDRRRKILQRIDPKSGRLSAGRSALKIF